MVAADISSTMTTYDGLPNLGLKMDMVAVTCTENGDWIDMADNGYTTVLWAVALVANAAEGTVTITDDTKVVFGAGGTDVLKVLVVGV